MTSGHSPTLRSTSRCSLLAGDSALLSREEAPLPVDNPRDTHHQLDGDNSPRGHASAGTSGGGSSPVSSAHLLEGLSAEKEEDTSLLCDKGKLLINILSDSKHKVPCPSRERIMEVFFDIQAMFMALRTKLSRAEGTIDELRSQLAECRGFEAAQQSYTPRPSYANAVRDHQSVLRGSQGPAPSLAPPQPTQQRPDNAVSFASDPNHVLHITPLLPYVHPGPETITLLKATFGNDPSGIGVKQVKLIPNRSGLTVISADRASIDNLEKAIDGNVQLKAAIKVTRPPRRLPQFKISGVDPSVVPGLLRTNINARNGLEISEEDFKHRTYFKDRSGNNVHIVEVSPSVCNILKKRDRLLIGWTSCPIKENFYVAACSRCCTYGHVATRCNSESVCCTYCAEEHAAADCTLADKERVVCRECRAAGRRSDHVFNAPCCYIVESRVSRMRQKTIYECTQAPCSSSVVSA